MAEFNPAPQPVNPDNFAFWARPIREPQPDTSKETLFKGAGQALDIAATGADQYIKTGIIAPQVEQQAGAVRDQFVDSLNTAKGFMDDQRSPTKDPESLPGTSVPTAVSQVGDRATSLQGALGAGKISETYYYGQLNSLAKSLRNQYPGYRDYIDQELGRVTGVHPANAYVRSLITDMNRIQGEHQEANNKIDAMVDSLAKEGWAPAAAYGQAVKNGTMTMQQFQEKTAGAFAFKYKLARDEAAHKEEDFSDADNKKWIASHVSALYSRDTAETLATPYIASGNSDPSKLIDDQKAGKFDNPQSDEDARLHAVQLQNTYNAKYAADIKHMNTPLSNGKTPLEMYGGDAKAYIDNLIMPNLSPFKNQIDAITNKDIGTAGLNAKLVADKQADQQAKMLTRYPDAAHDLAAMDLIKKAGGEQWMPDFMSDVANKHVLADLKALMSESTLNAAAQPDKSKGTLHTLADDINYAANKNVTDPHYYKGLLDGIKTFLQKDTPVQIQQNLADYFYSDANHQIMNSIKQDYRDPQTGKVIPGQFVAYAGLFNTATSDRMFKLAQHSPDPNTWNKYEASARENAFILFRGQMATLNDLQQDPINPMHFAYSTDGKLTALDINGKPLTRQAAASMHMHGVGTALDSVDNVNTMLRSLKSVFDKSDGDVSAELIEYLSELGFDPTKNVTGIPENIMRAIMASKPTAGPKDMGEAVPGFNK